MSSENRVELEHRGFPFFDSSSNWDSVKCLLAHRSAVLFLFCNFIIHLWNWNSLFDNGLYAGIFVLLFSRLEHSTVVVNCEVVVDNFFFLIFFAFFSFSELKIM